MKVMIGILGGKMPPPTRKPHIALHPTYKHIWCVYGSREARYPFAMRRSFQNACNTALIYAYKLGSAR